MTLAGTSSVVASLSGARRGLKPMPVLPVCLQLKTIALGFTLVLCFSFGLAITMVSTGALAAWSVHHASKHFKGFGEFARKATYVSSALFIGPGLFFIFQGWRHPP